MLMPSIFGENLFDDFFSDFPFYYDDKDARRAERKLYGRRASRLMKTDIRETDDSYEIVMDLPGFKKEEVKVALENSYLTVSAEKGLDEDEKEIYSIRLSFLARSPAYIPLTCGSVTWASSTNRRKSSGK